MATIAPVKITFVIRAARYGGGSQTATGRCRDASMLYGSGLYRGDPDCDGQDARQFCGDVIA